MRVPYIEVLQALYGEDLSGPVLAGHDSMSYYATKTDTLRSFVPKDKLLSDIKEFYVRKMKNPYQIVAELPELNGLPVRASSNRGQGAFGEDEFDAFILMANKAVEAGDFHAI